MLGETYREKHFFLTCIFKMPIQVKSHLNNNGINLCWVGNDTYDSVVFVDRIISHIGFKIAKRGEVDLENAI